MNSNLPEICSVSGGGGRHCLVTCSFLTNSRWTFMGLVLRCGFRLDPRTHRPNWRAALEESCWSSPRVTIRFLVREVLQGPSTAIAQSVWWPAPGRVLVVSAVLPLWMSAASVLVGTSNAADVSLYSSPDLDLGTILSQGSFLRLHACALTYTFTPSDLI